MSKNGLIVILAYRRSGYGRTGGFHQAQGRRTGRSI